MYVNATPYGTMLGSALFEQSCSQRLEKAQSIWRWVKTLYPWWTSTIINIAGKWIFIPLKMVLLGIEYGIDPWTYQSIHHFLPFKTVCVCFSWLLIGLHLVDGFGGNDDSRKDLHGCRCAMAPTQDQELQKSSTLGLSENRVYSQFKTNMIINQWV